MKAMSYTCRTEDVEEKRNWLISMGLILFRQSVIIDAETSQNTCLMRITFFVPDKETETYLKMTYPADTFRDCSA